MASAPGQATHNAELVTECLATLIELAPQLTAAERVHVRAQHPFVTDGWLEALHSASSGEIPPDVRLIAALEEHIDQVEQRERDAQDALLAAEERAAAAEECAAAAVGGGSGETYVDPAPLPPHLAKAGGRPAHRPPRPQTAASKRGGSPSPNASPRAPDSPISSARSSPKKGHHKASPSKGRKHAPHDSSVKREAEPQSRSRSHSEPQPHVDSGFWDEDDDGGTGHGVPNTEDEDAEEERRRAARAEKRFDSISEEIKAINAGEVAEPSTVDEVDSREPCPRCGRKFKPDRLARHITVCKALHYGQESRGVFNAASPTIPLAKPHSGTSKSSSAGGAARHASPTKGRAKTTGALYRSGVVAAGHSR
uniref:C2HC/C3H-type domain-containing protein n=1 Tax=Haptolina ericina TaxID=156174 RepID=A0A7S3AYD2_9EUKA|mmetsp:Transcript_39758/g.90128  ORF Transcript_39758/g.90128 Transcript_39758/m.90128 type:complete len:367 (+) Transcript_39758:33-1133(+)